MPWTVLRSPAHRRLMVHRGAVGSWKAGAGATVTRTSAALGTAQKRSWGCQPTRQPTVNPAKPLPERDPGHLCHGRHTAV